MTAGIPGAGIGGLFYLGTALIMPFRELWHVLRGRSSPASRRLVMRHVLLALAIFAGMWIAAWVLAFILTAQPIVASYVGMVPQKATEHTMTRFLSYSTLAVGVATLFLILAGVQVLRFILSPKISGRRILAGIGLAIALLAMPFIAHSQGLSMQRADAAYAKSDTATAEREYREVLRTDPDNSRALYQLAQLLRNRDVRASKRLLRRYIGLEPKDAWGFIALADFLGREQRYSEALGLYDRAVDLVSQERDAVVGRAHMLGRAGHLDQAIREYERWLSGHPNDLDAWSELARVQQRAGRIRSATASLELVHEETPTDALTDRLDYLYALGAPAVEPAVGFASDSDGNTKLRVNAGGDIAVLDAGRLGLHLGRSFVSDGIVNGTIYDLMVQTKWRPISNVQIDAAGGVAFVEQPAGSAGTSGVLATGRVRARTQFTGDVARLELRLNRILLDVTPLLVTNRVIRNEILFRPDVALVGPLRVRAAGGIGWVEGSGEVNTRTLTGGGLGWSLWPGTEISANVVQLAYAQPSQAGYFAPERVQSLEAGCYLEFEGEMFFLALDLGAGFERLKAHSFSDGSWKPSLRGYAYLSYILQPGRALNVEIDAYSTQAGSIIATTPGWKYISLLASLRWALP